MQLTSVAVNDIFMECLFKDDEVVAGNPVVPMLTAGGVVNNFGFHKERLEAKASDVADLLSQLPDGFQEDTGGGNSFLNACMTKTGVQWGEHANVEQLMCLGLALKLVEYCMPRSLWLALPGSVPYFVVKKPL